MVGTEFKKKEKKKEKTLKEKVKAAKEAKR